MTTMLNAPGRGHTRAIAIARVKFVILPPDPVAPVQTRARSLRSCLRAFILRVIGRLEAARP